MKKKVIFYFFKFSVLFFSVFLSCNEGYLGQDIQMEKLNDVGKAFMTHLLSNPDGKQQWEKLIRKGDIPPNEVALVFQGSRGWQYILPLLKDSTLIGMIIFPIEVTKENTHLAECLIDIPLVLEKENIISNTSAQGILKSSVSEKWKEKGITIDKKLITNQANLTPFLSRSRGSNGVFPAYYTLVIHNYLDSSGDAVINGMNISRFEDIAHEVVHHIPNSFEIELIIEDDIIFVITLHEDVAIHYYDLLSTRLWDRHHCEISFDFLWITGTPDEIGGGTGSSGGDTGENTREDTDIKIPFEQEDPGHIVVNLTTSELAGEVEIGDIYYLILDIYHTKQKPIPKITNIDYYINREGTKQGGSLGETTDWICARKAISAGTFQFVAVVQFEGQIGNTNSNTVTVKEMCPPISKFKNLPAIEKRAIELWNMSVNYTREHKSSHATKEFGCFIYMNTETGEYYCGDDIIEGDPVILDRAVEAQVHFIYSSQQYDPRLSFDLIIGTLHSHYPLTWAAQGVRRPVGPSSTDHAGNLPGLVYDYTQSISAGDPVNMPDNPKQIYPFGPNRRETL